MIADLQSRKWELQFQRFVTHIAEIDLIFQQGNEIRLIEVKTLDDPWRSFERISGRQIQKLKMNRLYFSSLFRNRFQFTTCIAWVAKDQIEYVEIS